MNPIAYALLGLGIIAILWGTIKSPQHRPTRTELNILYEERNSYLLQLKGLVGKYISYAETLVREDPRLYDSEHYLRIYKPPDRVRRKSGKYTDPLLFYIRTLQGIQKDNLVLKEVLGKELLNISMDINNLMANVKDRKLKKLIEKRENICHKELSAWLYFQLMKQSLYTSNVARAVYKIDSFMISGLHKYQSDISHRIDELLDGAEDE